MPRYAVAAPWAQLLWLMAGCAACGEARASTDAAVADGAAADASRDASVGDAGAGDAASTDAGLADHDGAAGVPGVQTREHAVNIVDAASAAEIRSYVLQMTPELYTAAASFYSHFYDDYDFLYVFTDSELSDPAAFDRFTPVRYDALPSVGLSGAYSNPAYGAHPRLRAAVGINFRAGGNGPTLHETLHYWSQYLDRRFGFGVDRDHDYGPHWGVAGVHGQHGGFDPTTFQCSTPMGGAPPCVADADGVIRGSIGAFGPGANGGDGLPYAPIELYLMGLLPKADVPSPILVVEGAHFVSTDASGNRFFFEIGGTHTVAMDEIVAVHGERPSAPPTDRAFRGAFVCFSDVPLSAATMDALERWAAVFGNDATTPGLLSFEAATGGRATMNTRLGAVH